MRTNRSSVISKITIILVLILLFNLLYFTPQVKSESKYAEILEIDADGYSEVISKGESAVYDWTLENVDEFNRTLNVTINVEVSNDNWITQLEPDNTITLKQKGDVSSVRLIVTPPINKNRDEIKTTLTISVEIDGVPIHLEKKETMTYLSEPEKKELIVFGLFTNPLGEPLDNEWGVFLLTVLIWLLISIIVVFLLSPVIKSFTKKTKTEIDDIILRIIRTPIMILTFFFGFVDSLVILKDHLHPLVIITISTLYGVAAVLILFYVAYKLFKDILVYYSRQIAAKTATKVDDVLVPIIEKVGIMILGLVALGYILGYLNIDLTIFVAGGVVVSMVIAFAAQETLSNFFSGIFILTDRPFKEKDTIILPDDDWYEVRHIGLRSTRLFRFKDASMVTIPNNKLANEKIANFTNPDDQGRVMKTYNVAYGSDVAKVKKIIREVIEKNPDIITDNEDLKPIVRFNEMSESSIDFFILIWVRDRGERANVIDYLNTEIYRVFNEEGIEIPFPQRVIHLKEDMKKGDSEGD